MYGCDRVGASAGAGSSWGGLWAGAINGARGHRSQRTPGSDGVRGATQGVGGQSGGSVLVWGRQALSKRGPPEVDCHQSCGFEMIQLNIMVITCNISLY